ncbi:MAG TPA: MBL fold metallo-hydrolase [Candidatus Pacearchaeota archaeon]|nr:MBL fold metallo-hydrolase [Candidatus Pacearchaeota archaeon]HPR79717.1 MBL fold metallo-hydrolase [Candidatus Pacearchaeota archaeon]
MKITWYGDSCFEIASVSKDKDNVLTIVDPKEGKKSAKADIILETHSYENGFETDEQFVISSCGEYERKGVFVQGIQSLQVDKKQRNIIYIIEAEDIRIAHLGYFGESDFSEEQIEEMGTVDILIVPVDGDKTISYAEAAKIVARIEPAIVIPMCYDSKKTEKGLKPFLKAMGEKEIEPQEKLSIQKKNISIEEKAEIVILEEK